MWWVYSVTNTNANSQNHLSPTKILERHDKEKKRQYNSCFINIEHGTITPLVFSVSGSIGKECSMFHKHIAQNITSKTGERSEKIMSIIRCALSFLILRCFSMCIRGSRSLQKSELVGDFAIAYDRFKCLWVEQFKVK